MAGIFSRIAAGEIPSYKVAENENYFAFLDIRPLVKGHTLVIPKQETDYIFDLTDDDYAGLFLFSKKVAKAIKKTINCTKVGMAVVGLEVPHAHVHLAPINNIDDLNFNNERVQLSKEEFQEIAAAIQANFE